MELIMIKQEGCGPCNMMAQEAPRKAKKNGLKFRIVDLESMPKEVQPPYTPYFYIMDGKDLVEQWGGGDLRKLTSVLNRNKIH